MVPFDLTSIKNENLENNFQKINPSILKQKVQEKFSCCGFNSIIEYCEKPEEFVAVVEAGKVSNGKRLVDLKAGKGLNTRKRRNVTESPKEPGITVTPAATPVVTTADTVTSNVPEETTTQPAPEPTPASNQAAPVSPKKESSLILDSLYANDFAQDQLHYFFTFDDLSTILTDPNSKNNQNTPHCGIKSLDNVCPNIDIESYHFERHGCNYYVKEFYEFVIYGLRVFTFVYIGLSGVCLVYGVFLIVFFNKMVVQRREYEGVMLASSSM